MENTPLFALLDVQNNCQKGGTRKAPNYRNKSKTLYLITLPLEQDSYC